MKDATQKIYLLTDQADVYNRFIAEAVIDELKDSIPNVRLNFINNFIDIVRSNVIILCGKGRINKLKVWFILFLRKPLIIYHFSEHNRDFQKLANRSKAFYGDKINTISLFPNPVLLTDSTTQKRIGRIWSKEKLVSKRGSIGILGLELDETQLKKLAGAVDLLIEDLDLNVIFLPITCAETELMHDAVSMIKYNSNIRNVKTDRYSSNDIFGIISKIDILITGGAQGALCAFAVNKPVISLKKDNDLKELMEDSLYNEIVHDIDSLSGDDIYSKIKIAWVHKDTIADRMRVRINDIKKQAEEGIRSLGKILLKR